LYKKIKGYLKEEKNYTVNTLVYSYNSICNTSKQRACEKKLKFIQEMLMYIERNDKNKGKKFANRNVMHVNYEVMYSE